MLSMYEYILIIVTLLKTKAKAKATLGMDQSLMIEMDPSALRARGTALNAPSALR